MKTEFTVQELEETKIPLGFVITAMCGFVDYYNNETVASDEHVQDVSEKCIKYTKDKFLPLYNQLLKFI